MAIVIEDIQMEHLAKQIAVAKGVSIPEVLRESLLAFAELRGLTMSKEVPLRERLAALAREADAMPVRVPLDQRSNDEILGYNECGRG
ncbi:MAG: type II toxin-antitoxin system VapB family antitoxin [Rhodanobacter sp.]|jgi:hypothetical protein|nr:type II toxin-antitoxin system VapB family antitoxin [Rhodanobacter sp.]